MENGVKRNIERGVDPEGKRGEKVLTPSGKEPVQHTREGTPDQPLGAYFGGEEEIHIHPLIVFGNTVNRETWSGMDEREQDNSFR